MSRHSRQNRPFRKSPGVFPGPRKRDAGLGGLAYTEAEFGIPLPSAVKPRHCVPACIAAALALILWQSARPARGVVAMAGGVLRTDAPSALQAAPAAIGVPPDSIRPARWPRAEAAQYLAKYFAREQLGLELELEQARYHGQYWQAEPGLAELQQIETRRSEAIRRLTSEMNGLLAEMSPDESGAPLALLPFFSLDHPAPNLGFLSEASREKMEGLLLARDEAADTDPMAAAAKILSGQELADYLRWNAPTSAALRNHLAGFNTSESEFAAILQWQEATGSDRETTARANLARQIGPDRIAQLERLTDPAMHTAVQDLHRLGLPLDQAGWLADFRRAASAQLQQSWRDPRLTAAQSSAEVGVMRDAFRAELATQMKLLPDAADLLP
jgi:hypothetical protein